MPLIKKVSAIKIQLHKKKRKKTSVMHLHDHCTWQESDDRCICIRPFIKVRDNLCSALAGVTADSGFVSDVTTAVHCGCDLTIMLFPTIDQLTELDLGHCQTMEQFKHHIKGTNHISLYLG